MILTFGDANQTFFLAGQQLKQKLFHTKGCAEKTPREKQPNCQLIRCHKKQLELVGIKFLSTVASRACRGSIAPAAKSDQKCNLASV